MGLAPMNDYKKPNLLFNAHAETIYPSLFRRVPLPPYERERLFTDDDDFLDVDWLRQGAQRVVIVSHGLEGNSERPYVKGMARAFFQAGYDVLAWNYRGCSEEMNRQRRFYHSGATDDLNTVVRAAARYTSVVLCGFSLGGNLTLKYLGEATRDERIEKAIVFSVPMHLHASCIQISKPGNWLYARRFLRSLKKKVQEKALTRTDLDISDIGSIHTLLDFDDRYTSQLHGYRDAVDYYTQCSSLRFVENIETPTLIVNATNDPFLAPECYPVKRLAGHPHVKFETPRHGGHVGFAQFNKKGLFWSEERALTFATSGL